MDTEINSIYNDLLKKRELGLYNGFSSILFLRFSKKEILKNIDIILSEIFLSKIDFSFSTGVLGVAWIIAFKSRICNIEYYSDVLMQLDDLVLKFSINELNQSNYDFMHNGLGGILYFIERKDDKNILKLLNILKKKTIKYNEFDLWYDKFSDYLYSDYKINLGLAHGVASVLAIYNIILKEGFFTKRLKKEISTLLNFYDTLMDMNSNPVLPTFIVDGECIRIKLNLAWCYGDLGVIYQLLWAAILIKDKNKELKILGLLKKLSNIRLKDSNVIVAGFCHGSYGIAYIFHKLWLKTKINCFKKSSSYWSIIGEDILKKQKCKSNENVKKEWHLDNSLLLGSIGIELIKKTMKKNIESSWDRCFLLS